MRLLFVSHSLPPVDRPLANIGGMQRVAGELYVALGGVADVQLSSHLLRSSWRWTHVRILPFAGALLHRLPRLVEREGIEAVLFSSMVTAALALPIAGFLRQRGVVTAAIPVGRDVTLPFWPYQRLVPTVFRSLDRIFPISRATAAECLERGATPDKLRIVPCGVDPSRFAGSSRRQEARTQLEQTAASAGYSLPPEAMVLFSVGRHVERKGFAWFIEQVMPRLPEHVHLWLAGEGPATPSIRAAIDRHRLGHRVRLLGRVSEEELSTLYSAADLFVMPNIPVPGDIEGFGVVMLEAGIHGLPIVAAAIEGILDVVHDGKNGRLVTSGDREAFAAAILALLNDSAARETLARSAADFVGEAFGWPAIAEQYVAHIRDVSRFRGNAGSTFSIHQPSEPS